MNPVHAALAKVRPSRRASLIARLPAHEQAYIASLFPPTLREFAEEYCGLKDLSPLMAAVMDAADGVLVTTIDDDTSEKHFGCKRGWLPKRPSRTVAIRAGARSGKTSRLLAVSALHAAWTVPVPLLAHGESAYAVVVAPSLKLARQALSFIRGFVDTSAILSGAKTGEDADHVSLIRQDGVTVRIEAFAASRGGAQLRGKTLVGASMDEAAFWHDESTGVINDTELYRALIPRLVPGGRCFVVSTPWIAGIGLLEDLISKNFGSHENALAVTAPTKDLNPSWDPDGSITADLIANDSDAYDREILANPLTAGSQQFFSPEAIKAAINHRRPQKLPKRQGAFYGAGGDMGFRRNSSTLAVVERDSEIYRAACIDELKPEPGQPLKPAGVVDHFAPTIAEYGCESLSVDSHERQEVSLELARHHLGAVDAPDKTESYILTRKLFHEGKLEIPNNPRLVKQLREVLRKPMPGGGIQIISPRSPDGSHGDLVSGLVNAVWQASLAAPFKIGRVRSSRY